MAILKMGPLAQAASGSIGGITIATGRSTHTVRIKPKHRSSTTQDALAARARFTTQMLAWEGITDEERTGWINAAHQFTFKDALSQRRFLTPFQLFVKMRTFQTTFASRPTFPTGPTTTAPETLVLTAVILLDRVQALITYNGPEDSNILIYGRRSFKRYPTKPRKPFKFLSATASKPATVTLTSIWKEKIGTPVEDEYLEIEAFTIADRKFPSFRLRAGTIVVL